MTELLKLAERCEQAKGPRWDINEDIAKALGWYCRKETSPGLNGRTPGRTVWRRPDHVKVPLPKFSKSLDAAMTLVPEGCYLKELGEEQNRDHAGCVIGTASNDDAVAWASARSLPLALCAASLRARAKEEGDG